MSIICTVAPPDFWICGPRAVQPNGIGEPSSPLEPVADLYDLDLHRALLRQFLFYIEIRCSTLEELAKIVDSDDAQVVNIDLEQVEKEIEITEKESLDHRE